MTTCVRWVAARPPRRPRPDSPPRQSPAPPPARPPPRPAQHETRLHWWADRVISYERKYHGRWTFDRVLGAHEIASVVFSFGNLVENVRCGLRCRRLHRRALSGAGKAASERDRWRMWLWRPSWYATLVAWHLSMWYHLKPRNRDASEMLDVTVAGSIPTMGFLFALAVTTDLGTPWLLRCIQGVLAAQVAHAASMFVWYDNARQLAWAVLVQVVQFPLWVRWVRSPEGRGHPARWRVFVFVGLMNVCFLFEAFDFGPIWRLFDAHAIWHLCTIPVVHFWYDFIEGDLVHMERKLNGKAGEDAAGPPAAPASRGEAGSGDEEAARPRRRGFLGGPRAGA